MKLKKMPTIAGILLFFACWLFFTFPANDVDLGWHLKYGEQFLETGKVEKTNQFSATMPGYYWVNHSWGFDPIAALIFGGNRFFLLSITGGLLIAVSLILLVPTVTFGYLAAVLAHFYWGGLMWNTGLRSQLFSLLFTSLLWKWLLRFSKTKNVKSLYPLPLLFLLWANLHGQYLLGLTLMTLFLLLQISKIKNNRFLIIGLNIASAAATLVNPFGINLWTLSINHLNAPELKYIFEWMPLDLFSPPNLAFIGFVSIGWYWIIKKKQGLHIVLPLLIMTYLSLKSRRMILFTTILFIPFVAGFIDHKLPSKKVSGLILPSLIVILAAAGFLVSRRGILRQSWDTYCGPNIYCSEKARSYILEHNLSGKFFTAYRLGGYMIYRLPQIKPMIDGRMTIWRDLDGNSPYLNYNTIVHLLPGWQQKFAAINPDYVFIQPMYPLSAKLTQMGWQLLFNDENVVLFKNPNL